MKTQRTVINLNFLLLPLFLLSAIPTLLLLALIIGQVVVYGGWHN